MKFKGLNMSEASHLMERWKLNSAEYLDNELDAEYRPLRNELMESFVEIDTPSKYRTDCEFGMKLYSILEKYGFTVRDAADDDTWRFLSMRVVPDIVAERWGKTAEIRYFKNGLRIWLKTIWWYVHLSINGDMEMTARILEKNSTDQILQLVDRVGKKGYYIEVYRKIMYYFWIARSKNSAIGDGEFRKVMVLHTALCRSVEPGFYPGGAEGYVRMIYRRLGIDIDE